MLSTSFSGYPSRVWGTCWQALSWLSGQFAANPSQVALDTPVETVVATLRNGLEAITVWQLGAILLTEAQAFNVLESLPLAIDNVTRNCLNNRAASIAAVARALTGLVPIANPLNVTAPLSSGIPVITSPKFLEWCMTFNGEPSPESAFLLAGVDTTVQAWRNIVNAVFAAQGANPTSTYDTAARQYRCVQVNANILKSLQTAVDLNNNIINMQIPMLDSAGNVMTDSLNQPMYTTSFLGGATAAWSTAVALPTILLDATALANNPASTSSQQVSVIRYVLLSQLINLSTLLLSFRSQTVKQPAIAYLRNTESLMDMAARTSGNFENWSDIAALNNIQPPYPSANNPQLALAGRPLFTAGVGLPSKTAKQPTYAANVLGTDYDFGPINGPAPPWLGDIPLITGYLNFARSIGRRLQTPLGSLVYHPSYGCGIPPEVGAITSNDEAGKLSAFARSAVAADPRTGSIQLVNTVIKPGFEADVSVALTPIGPGALSVGVNEVIGAAV
jgi:hypothetical protein